MGFHQRQWQPCALDESSHTWQQICVYLVTIIVTPDNKEFRLPIRYKRMVLLYKWHDWQHRLFVLLRKCNTYQSIGIIIFHQTLDFEGQWSGISISTAPEPMCKPSRKMVWFSLQHVFTELITESLKTGVMKNSQIPFSFGHIDPIVWCITLYLAFAYQYLLYYFSYSDC